MSANYKNFLDKMNVLLFCGGKYGSSTLFNTFKKNNYKTLKLHGRLSFIRKFNHDGLNNFINRASSNKKLYIIDSYRTPIERKISSFFQNLDKHVPNFKNKNIKQLINIFNNKYLNLIAKSSPIDTLMKQYKVKSFDKFDFEKRICFKKMVIVFIKILFSDINNWGNIFSKIFNKKIIIYPYNLSKKKQYNLLYQKD